MTDARDIYQAHLDEVSQALWDRDYDVVIRAKRYPHVIRFSNEHHVFETPEACRQNIETFRTKLEGLGATAFHRVCERASFDPQDQTRITGAHWTYILRGGNYLTDPYTCEMALVLNDMRWAATDIILPNLKHGIPTAGTGLARENLH